MILLTQKNNYECVLTSVAMCMNITPDVIRRYLDHDPDEIIWSEERDPFCKRGIQIEDLLPIIYTAGYYAMPFFKNIMVKGKVIRLAVPATITRVSGIFMFDSASHVVAWNHEEQVIYDPSGVKLPYNDSWCEFWAIGKLI